MKMRESEIFENYIRLATDAGLISEDDIKKTADSNDKTRYDRYSFSDLEALYGHKFTPDKDEDKNISDVAHPDTFVVGPAYDAMNAVVENLQQRNNIMTYVALKQPDGHLVQRRYVSASQDLINSLVSTGFTMDSANEEDLMKLADTCAEKVSNASLKKNAFWGLAISAAMALAPAIIDYVSGKQAERTAALSGGSRREAARIAAKKKPEIAGKIKGGFKRAGLGLVILGAYQVIKDQFLGNVDRGIDQNAQRLQEELVDLYEKADASAKSRVQAYLREVEEIRDANARFTSRVSSLNIDPSNFYQVEAAGEAKEYVEDFYQQKLEFDRVTQSFSSFLESMSLERPDTFTNTDEEIYLRDKWEELTGSIPGVRNAMITLSDSLTDYMNKIGASIGAAQSGVDQVAEEAAEKGAMTFEQRVASMDESGSIQDDVASQFNFG